MRLLNALDGIILDRLLLAAFINDRVAAAADGLIDVVVLHAGSGGTCPLGEQEEALEAKGGSSSHRRARSGGGFVAERLQRARAEGGHVHESVHGGAQDAEVRGGEVSVEEHTDRGGG